MSPTQAEFKRPPAYVTNLYPWNLGRVPETAETPAGPIPHPSRHCAIFVVHGMGEQEWTATAALLRSGFEDALEAIQAWQASHAELVQTPAGQVPPPFIYDGYWANYVSLEKTPA